MTKKEQEIFDGFASLRDKRGLPLRGWRWLTCDDVWETGDEYDGSSGWWKIGGRDTGVKPGSKVMLQMLCYTPRGKR